MAGVWAVKPYYDDGMCVIYHGDCREVLPTLQPIDLVVTDPPYGINYVTNYRSWRTHIAVPVEGDDAMPVDVVPLLADLLVEGGALYWFGTEDAITPFRQAAEVCGLRRRRVLVWDKLNWASGDLEGDWASRCEFIPWAAKGRHRLRGGRPHNLLAVRREVAATRVVFHPSQKPLELLSHIIQASSDAGQTVLDPFMGSGSTLRAAKDLGRRAIGIEIEERYCEIAAKRLGQEVLAL